MKEVPSSGAFQLSKNINYKIQYIDKSKALFDVIYIEIENETYLAIKWRNYVSLVCLFDEINSITFGSCELAVLPSGYFMKVDVLNMVRKEYVSISDLPNFQNAKLQKCNCNELEHEYIKLDNDCFAVKSKQDAHKRAYILACYNSASRGNYSSECSASYASEHWEKGILKCAYGYSDINGTKRKGKYSIFVISPDDFLEIACRIIND